MSDTVKLHNRVKDILYTITGITLTDNKDVMINNRLQKLQRDTKFQGSLEELLDEIEQGNYTQIFINSFTTNKTHFFREAFHFEDLRDRVIPEFIKEKKELKMYCSATSTGEEPYSMAMTVLNSSRNLRTSIIATDIDTNVLQYAANGIYRYSKSKNEFPQWIKPQEFFKRRVQKSSLGEEVLIRVKDDLKRVISFQEMNLNDSSYPFSPHQFDVVFCRNVLIYFTVEDQNRILQKLFSHLKVGGTLYLGHSESQHDLFDYTKRVGQNIFVKLKDGPW
jgi:chemotaxis protein methyltransferase CheR